MLYFLSFIFYKKKSIKGKTFVNARENKCRPLRHLRPETGESLDFFFKSLIKLYISCFLYDVLPFYNNLFIKGKILVYSRESIFWPLRQLRLETGKNPANVQITNQTLFVVLLLLLLGSPTMENLPVNSIEIGTNYYDVDDHSTLSSKTYFFW